MRVFVFFVMALTLAVTVEASQAKKVVVGKYSTKKRIRVKTGHRQQYTQLKIESIKVE